MSDALLPSGSTLSLWVPEGGFPRPVKDALRAACASFPELEEAYLALRGEPGTLFFALQFYGQAIDAEESSHLVNRVMEKLMSLFDHDVAADAICLNEQTKLRNVIASLVEPFFERSATS